MKFQGDTSKTPQSSIPPSILWFPRNRAITDVDCGQNGNPYRYTNSEVIDQCRFLSFAHGIQVVVASMHMQAFARHEKYPVLEKYDLDCSQRTLLQRTHTEIPPTFFIFDTWAGRSVWDGENPDAKSTFLADNAKWLSGGVEKANRETRCVRYALAPGGRSLEEFFHVQQR
jgi:hypothetical protein